jgi:hypothetical protein
VLALEPLRGTRIVASPATLDAAVWPSSATVLRLAPDDVLVIGGESVSASGPHSIVAPDHGWSGTWLSSGQLARVAAHIDWPLPAGRPALAQGFVANVPCKLYLAGVSTGSVIGADRAALLITNTAYAHELAARLGPDLGAGGR